MNRNCVIIIDIKWNKFIQMKKKLHWKITSSISFSEKMLAATESMIVRTKGELIKQVIEVKYPQKYLDSQLNL